MTDSTGPNPPTTDDVSMKRVLISAALLSIAAIGIWMVLGGELRGYDDSLAPGGVTITSEKNAASIMNEASVEQAMIQGVSLLHELGDPEAAISHFSTVLEYNPEHYGALYQIASAFERTQQLYLAHLTWVKFEPLARQSKDSTSLSHAQERIATLKIRMSTLEEKMVKGVELLHGQGRPAEALPYFEDLRNAWPSHYGARYQHALALEQTGQHGASEGAWLQFLASAEDNNNREDIQTAKAAIVRVRALQESEEPG